MYSHQFWLLEAAAPTPFPLPLGSVPQILFNKDYLFYSGAVVNNPHGYAVHAFVGALPPSTYHWRDLGKQHPPFVNVSTVVDLYYGKNIYDQVRATGGFRGSRQGALLSSDVMLTPHPCLSTPLPSPDGLQNPRGLHLQRSSGAA